MAGFAVSEWIACPPQRVFEFISDANNAPQIVPAVKSTVKLTEGPPRVGTRYRETRLMNGKEQHVELEVKEYAAPEVYAMQNVTDGFETVYRYTLRPEREGTHIDLVCEVKAGGVKEANAALDRLRFEKGGRGAFANIEGGDGKAMTL